MGKCEERSGSLIDVSHDSLRHKEEEISFYVEQDISVPPDTNAACSKSLTETDMVQTGDRTKSTGSENESDSLILTNMTECKILSGSGYVESQRKDDMSELLLQLMQTDMQNIMVRKTV